MFPQIYDWMNRHMSRFTVPFSSSSSIITNTMQLSNSQNVAGLMTQRTIPGATVATTALRERDIIHDDGMPRNEENWIEPGPPNPSPPPLLPEEMQWIPH
jgi:hypothetical protein